MLNMDDKEDEETLQSDKLSFLDYFESWGRPVQRYNFFIAPIIGIVA